MYAVRRRQVAMRDLEQRVRPGVPAVLAGGGVGGEEPNACGVSLPKGCVLACAAARVGCARHGTAPSSTRACEHTVEECRILQCSRRTEILRKAPGGSTQKALLLVWTALGGAVRANGMARREGGELRRHTGALRSASHSRAALAGTPGGTAGPLLGSKTTS